MPAARARPPFSRKTADWSAAEPMTGADWLKRPYVTTTLRDTFSTAPSRISDQSARAARASVSRGCVCRLGSRDSNVPRGRAESAATLLGAHLGSGPTNESPARLKLAVSGALVLRVPGNLSGPRAGESALEPGAADGDQCFGDPQFLGIGCRTLTGAAVAHGLLDAATGWDLFRGLQVLPARSSLPSHQDSYSLHFRLKCKGHRNCSKHLGA